MENNDLILYANIIKKYKIQDSDNVYFKKVHEQLIHDFVNMYEELLQKERTIDKLQERLYMLEEEHEAHKQDEWDRIEEDKLNG